MYVFDYFSNEEDQADHSHLFIHNVGFSHNRPGYSAGVVKRNYNLLHYIASGKGTYEINGHVYHLSSNDGFLVPENTPVIYTADDKDPWTCYWVGFSGTIAPLMLKQAHLSTLYVFHYDKDSFIAETMEDFYNNIRDSFCPQETLSGYLFLIIGKLIHISHEEQKVVPFTPFQSATSFIQRSVYSSISLQDVVNYIGLSSSQLYRIFMKEIGIAPYHYIIKVKIDKACKLIQNTDMSYCDIANMLGFDYESHFFKLFHKVTGVTPSYYRTNSSMQKHETN